MFLGIVDEFRKVFATDDITGYIGGENIGVDLIYIGANSIYEGGKIIDNFNKINRVGREKERNFV